MKTNTMKVTMSNFVALNVLNDLNKFSHITGILGYAISMTKKDILEQVRIFNDEREKLVRKYGTENEDKTISVKEDSENYKEFIKEYIPLAQANFEANIYQITQEQFDNTDIFNEKISVGDYEWLEGLFVDRTVKETSEEKSEPVENSNVDEAV